MYDRILLATDGSEHADVAASHAIHTADREGATLYVLFVAEKTRDDPETTGLEEGISEDLDRGDEIIKDVVESADKKGVEVASETVIGHPKEAIREYVEEKDVDLIVMGSVGRSGIKRVVLGSVTEDMIRSASVPVLTMRSNEG
jgi:nucleotide-binding universal stress UspA family protein